MPGPNTTGLANTEDYNLGRGKLYFAELDAGGLPKAFRDLGNVPQFNLSMEVETLDHKSSRQGLKTVDKEVTISQAVNVSFQGDELNHENLALVFSGAKATHVNVSIAGFTEYTMVADGTIETARHYQIVNASGERAYDVEAADLAISTTNATPVPLVKDTDYTLDSEMGMVMLLSTSSVVDTAISLVEGLDVTLTARGDASVVEEVQALTTTSVVGALKFISENPANNDKQQEFHFHQITLKSDGDLSMIGDDWSVAGFTGAAEQNVSADADSPTLTIRSVTLPTAA